jgi:hypothetical protein
MIDIDTDEFSFPLLDLETTPATSAQVRIDVAGLSDKGRVRQRNEDHYFVARGGRHVTTLLDKVTDPDARAWYAAQDVEHGWSTPVLTHHITSNRHERIGGAPNNFRQVMAPAAGPAGRRADPRRAGRRQGR